MKLYPFLIRLVIVCCFLMTLGQSASAQNASRDQFEYRGNLKINTRTNTVAAMYNIISRVYQGTPEEIARQFLNENKTILGISAIPDLKFIETTESPAGKHVGFIQTYHGIPVFQSETVVSINRDSRVTMVVNGNLPITAVKNLAPSISREVAIDNAIAEVMAEQKTLITQPNAELYIYRDSLNQLNLTWKVSFVANNPVGDWQVFVDAGTGDILSVMDISFRSVSGECKAFKPDPVTSLQNTSLTDQNNADYPALQSAYKTVTLPNLNDPVGGLYRLQGTYARSEDVELPNTTTVTSSTSSFVYNRSQPGFEETNVYYFLDG